MRDSCRLTACGPHFFIAVQRRSGLSKRTVSRGVRLNSCSAESHPPYFWHGDAAQYAKHADVDNEKQ